jgi:hypothetical protein
MCQPLAKPLAMPLAMPCADEIASTTMLEIASTMMLEMCRDIYNIFVYIAFALIPTIGHNGIMDVVMELTSLCDFANMGAMLDICRT